MLQNLRICVVTTMHDQFHVATDWCTTGRDENFERLAIAKRKKTVVEFVEKKEDGNNNTISTKCKGDSLFSRDKSKARIHRRF